MIHVERRHFNQIKYEIKNFNTLIFLSSLDFLLLDKGSIVATARQHPEVPYILSRTNKKSSTGHDREPFVYLSSESSTVFSDELVSPPGVCLSVSEEKALKTELAQVTSTNSPQSPFPKSLMKGK